MLESIIEKGNGEIEKNKRAKGVVNQKLN